MVLLQLRRVLGRQGSPWEGVAGADSSMAGVDRREAGIDIGRHSRGLGQLERHYIPSRTNELVDANSQTK